MKITFEDLKLHGVKFIRVLWCDNTNLISSTVTDACTTYTHERHTDSIAHIRGYCRQVTSAEFLRELES